MDYKKKYEEALNKARELNGTVAAGRDFLAEIFPELAESEDERTRQGLIEMVRTVGDGVVYALSVQKQEEYLAWLEKQKDLFEPYDWNEYKDKPVELWNSYIHGLAVGLERGKAAVKNNPKEYGLEKQKENIEREYVFRPLAGTDITIAAEQAIRRANEGDRLVLAFNGAYIPVRKGCNANKIVEIYDAFIEKQKDASKAIEAVERVQCRYTRRDQGGKAMKEIWLTKGAPRWMPFHLIFFKNADWLILPCVSFVKKNKKKSLGSEIVFGFLRWRMSIYFHNGN